MVFLRMGFGSKIGISSAFGEDEESKGEGSVNGNFKDLSRLKASFKSVPPQPYFEFPATLRCWLA